MSHIVCMVFDGADYESEVISWLKSTCEMLGGTGVEKRSKIYILNHFRGTIEGKFHVRTFSQSIYISMNYI